MKLLVKPSKRKAVSPVIATLLLIAIAVAAAIIVYAFVTGLIGGLTSSGASLVVVSGSLTVPTGTGTGTLVVTVNNKASNAINAVTIATDGADTTLSVVYQAQYGANSGTGTPGSAGVAVLCGTLSAAQLAVVTGCPATNTFGIAIGSSASAVGAVDVAGVWTGAVAGTTYTFTIASYIGSSTTPNLQTFSVTAQV